MPMRKPRTPRRDKGSGSRLPVLAKTVEALAAVTPCQYEVAPGKVCGVQACREHGAGLPTVADLMRVSRTALAEPYYPKSLWSLVRSLRGVEEAAGLTLEAAYLRRLVDLVSASPQMTFREQVQAITQIMAEIRATTVANAKIKIDNDGMMSPAAVEDLLSFVIRTIKVYLPDQAQQVRFANDIRAYVVTTRRVVDAETEG